MPVDEKQASPIFGAIPPVKMTATAISGFDETLTVVPGATNLTAGAVPQGNYVALTARPSWGVVAVQYVGDRREVAAVVHAAGRRVVTKYGEALERLAD